MPKPVQIIRLLVGSPSELAEERLRLRDVVDELNIFLGNALNVRLDLVKWETHARPGVAAEAQAVIDTHVGDDYEIFLGILATRFGTPTRDAGSGTEHEFNKAHSRYLKDPSQVSIMFYFKDSPVIPSQVDVAQLLKVEEFKKKLGALGSLYWTYQTADDFVNLVRLHLGKELQNWCARAELEPKLRMVSQPQVSEAAPELGFFDFLEIVENGFKSITELSAHLGAAINHLGEKLSLRTGELNQAQSMDQSSRLRHFKRVANAAAQDMQEYCNETEPKIPQLGRLYRESTSALIRAALMSQEFGGNPGEDLVALFEQMRSLVHTLADVRSHIQSFREVIASSPRTTSAYIAAQKRTTSVQEILDREFATIQQHTTELLTSLAPLTQVKAGGSESQA